MFIQKSTNTYHETYEKSYKNLFFCDPGHQTKRPHTVPAQTRCREKNTLGLTTNHLLTFSVFALTPETKCFFLQVMCVRRDIYGSQRAFDTLQWFRVREWECPQTWMKQARTQCKQGVRYTGIYSYAFFFPFKK